MTIEELKEKIAESEHSDELNSQEFTFKFPYISYEESVIGVEALMQFVMRQIEGFDKIEDHAPLLASSLRYFENLHSKIVSWSDNEFKSSGYSYYDEKFGFGSIWDQINDNSNSVIPFNVPEAEFLRKAFVEHPKLYTGAAAFITDNVSSTQLKDTNYFSGLVLAYEFSNEGNALTERKTAERSLLEKLRNEFEVTLQESQDNLNTQLAEADSSYSERTKAMDELRDEKREAFDNLSKEKAQNFDKWFEAKTTDFNTFDSEAKKKVDSLEKAYNDLLKLKAPAEHWKIRAQKLRRQGWIFASIIIALVLGIASCLYFLLWQTPEGLLATFFSNDVTLAVKWSIVFITFISFLAYGIRALTKAMFSAFHLARDAEEREALTFFYLALLKESSVEQEDRVLILQSLFSRADTGMLKDDAGPSMPAGVKGIIDKAGD